jgi:succinylglutamate desuccinylase
LEGTIERLKTELVVVKDLNESLTTENKQLLSVIRTKQQAEQLQFDWEKKNQELTHALHTQTEELKHTKFVSLLRYFPTRTPNIDRNHFQLLQEANQRVCVLQEMLNADAIKLAQIEIK